MIWRKTKKNESKKKENMDKKWEKDGGRVLEGMLEGVFEGSKEEGGGEEKC